MIDLSQTGKGTGAPASKIDLKSLSHKTHGGLVRNNNGGRNRPPSNLQGLYGDPSGSRFRVLTSDRFMRQALHARAAAFRPELMIDIGLGLLADA